jgi:branched-chain amino acid aminotransferase
MTFATLDKLTAGYIWLNGELVPWQDAKIHALNHGLHYAGSVFEGERSYEGKIFKIEEHTDRLLNSAKTMYLDVRFSKNEIIDAHQLLIEKNKIMDSYIRPLIFRGPESLNISNPNLSTNVLIAAIPITKKSKPDLKIHLSKWTKPHPSAVPPQVKSSGHYNMMIVAQMDAKHLGFDDALLLDWRGFVAECTTSNIFFARQDVLITPIADAFLDGITRQTIINIAKNLGLQVKESYIEQEDIKNYSECFVTGTAIEVAGVSSITLPQETIKFNENKIGSLMKAEYAKLAGSPS